MSGQIGEVLSAGQPLDIFRPLIFLPDNDTIVDSAFDYMLRYNLLPNDALILSLCKIHEIKYLATFDPDFEIACKGENIILLRQIEDLREVIPSSP